MDLHVCEFKVILLRAYKCEACVCVCNVPRCITYCWGSASVCIGLNWDNATAHYTPTDLRAPWRGTLFDRAELPVTCSLPAASIPSYKSAAVPPCTFHLILIPILIIPDKSESSSDQTIAQDYPTCWMSRTTEEWMDNTLDGLSNALAFFIGLDLFNSTQCSLKMN